MGRVVGIGRAARLGGCAATALAVLAALAVVAGCGHVRAAHRGMGGRSAEVRTGCLTTVRGVVTGSGSLVAGWLPSAYRLQAGSESASSLPSATYVRATGHADPPRVMLGSVFQRGPLTATDGGRSTGVPVLIQGHRGLLESGPPNPQFIGAYWKPSGGYLVSVVGYKVSGSVVLRVARSVSFAAPGIIALPVTPGRIVSRQAAITAAKRAADLRQVHAAAKLSSWTEIEALAVRVQQVQAAPAVLTRSPWRPVWAVLLTGAQARPAVVVVDAASGIAVLTIAVRGPWFPGLTDRDPTRTRQCPGGSSAWVPFGVLTRNEQAYASRGSAATGGARTSVRLVLSTVPAVNRADSGLYGGCAQQNCSIGELVWVTIATVRAAPGKTVACLPGSVSVPPGYKPKHVRQYYTVSVPDSDGIYCGSLPGSLLRLTDLAPAAPER